jgi:hypothetical protein
MEATEGTSDSCSYNPDYRRESEILFETGRTGGDRYPCQGYGWIGQTWNLSVEPYVKITCPTEQLTLWARTRISDNPSPLFQWFVEKVGTCQGGNGTGAGKECSSSVSMPGTTGKRYCVNAHIHTYVGVGERDGWGDTCIWT